MPTKEYNWGDNVGGSQNLFVRVKQKGDKIQFRIGQMPVFKGKHFKQLTSPDGMTRWEVPECPRIMDGDECSDCIEFFKRRSKMKKLLNGRQEKNLEPAELKQYKQWEDEARPYAPTIEFYYPVLDRSDGKFKILQTTNGVTNKFNAKREAGIDPMETEWILSNTGQVGALKYDLNAVDSAKVKEFTPEEEAEWAKAQGYDLSSIGGSQDDE